MKKSVIVALILTLVLAISAYAVYVPGSNGNNNRNESQDFGFPVLPIIPGFTTTDMGFPGLIPPPTPPAGLEVNVTDNVTNGNGNGRGRGRDTDSGWIIVHVNETNRTYEREPIIYPVTQPLVPAQPPIERQPPELTTKQSKAGLIVFTITAIILLIALIFAIIYAYNRRFHRTVDHFRKTVEQYEHKVHDLAAHQFKLKQHLAAQAGKPHPRHDLRGISHYHHSIKQLLTYIESHLNKGYSFENIRSILLKKGWTDEHIREAYKLKGLR